MYLKQKYEVFSLVVGATAVNSLDWEQNQTHYFHIENCCSLIDLVDISPLSYKISIHAGVAELADALRSGRSEHSARESSNLSFGTIDLLQRRSFHSQTSNCERHPQWYNICNKGSNVYETV